MITVQCAHCGQSRDLQHITPDTIYCNNCAKHSKIVMEKIEPPKPRTFEGPPKTKKKSSVRTM